MVEFYGAHPRFVGCDNTNCKICTTKYKANQILQ
jgi:hypothetical protein